MTWDVSRRVFLRGAGLAAVGVGLAPTSLLVRTGARRGGRKGAGQGLPARRRRRAQPLRPLRRPRVQQPAPGHSPSPPRVTRRRREPGRLLRHASRVRPPRAVLQRRAPGLRPRGRKSPGDPLPLRRPGLPGVGDPRGQADPHRLARPGDREDAGHRGDAGGLLLVRSSCGRSWGRNPCSWRRRCRRSTCGPETGAPRPSRVSPRCTRPTRPRSAPPASRRSRR